MSRHHYTHVTEALQLEHDMQHLSARELERLYGIQFIESAGADKTGQVYDTVSGKTFNALADWAVAQNEEEAWSEAEHHQISRKFDEEF